MEPETPVEKVDELVARMMGGHLSRREFMAQGARLGFGVSALAAILAACSSSGAPESTTAAGEGGTLVVANWGGPEDDARKKVVYPAFEKEFGTKITDVAGAVDYGKVKAMVDASRPQYDVVSTAISLLYTLGPSYFEKIDYSRKPELWTDVINTNDYAVPEYIGAEPILYRTDAFPTGQGPQNWQDFWDTKKFPGKRALGADGGVPWFTLECAVLAAGTPVPNLYPIDFDTAFSALDKLRSTGDLVFWSSTADGARLLAGGQVAIARLVPGVVWDLITSGQVAISWFNAIGWNESNHILKGSKSVAQAQNYVEFIVDPERQAAMSQLSHYGPVNRAAVDAIPQSVKELLPVPDDQLPNIVWEDYKWYGDHYDQMVQRWTEWQQS